MFFTWGNPVNWVKSRRHLAAYYLHDTTNKKRIKWVEIQSRIHGGTSFELKRSDLPAEFSFLVLGDPGEGDLSQMVLVDKIIREGADTSFAIIAGDVVYPSGRSADYLNKFYVPYRQYSKDIYAVPGNHDWYDELVGFMIHFCDNCHEFRDPAKPTVDQQKLKTLRSIRHNRYIQPNMYFYMDTQYVRLVAIDVGIRGYIDPQQLEWLSQVSNVQKPKILIMGKPIYADGKSDPGLSDVDQIVRSSGYILVIGGDTHNFQRYRFPRSGGKYMYHLVNGGGGAYLSKTHDIPAAPAMTALGVKLTSEPEDFTCFPSRDDSRKYFEHGWLLGHIPDWARDRDRPPYHKSFVKVRVGPSSLHLEAFGVDDFSVNSLNRPAIYPWVIPY